MSLSVYEKEQLIKTFSHEIGHFLVIMQQTTVEFRFMHYEDCTSVREYETAITEFKVRSESEENFYNVCRISIAGVIAEYLYNFDSINYEKFITNFETLQVIDKDFYDRNLDEYLRLTNNQEYIQQIKEEIYNSVLSFLKEKREKIKNFTNNMIKIVIKNDNGINFPTITLKDTNEIDRLMNSELGIV